MMPELDWVYIMVSMIPIIPMGLFGLARLAKNPAGEGLIIQELAFNGG